ncbi:hypothetical protein [Nocardia camponoti]|uniref:Uncharacterized protein n=1 Tax=Nocardia camponoti TaxID=1616106 RepID=A0A917QGT9_9NOCA|nr:hypothetical protein [Nocardia camponoti]GGK48410.1 hypothetical protein GCM10011591_19770 [Nocardia camponoti]
MNAPTITAERFAAIVDEMARAAHAATPLLRARGLTDAQIDNALTLATLGALDEHHAGKRHRDNSRPDTRLPQRMARVIRRCWHG